MTTGILGYFNYRHLGVTLCFESAEDFNVFLNKNTHDLSALPDEERFRKLLFKSALVHEVRHFHDYLLTGYGCRLFFYWNMVLANGAQVFLELLRNAHNTDLNVIIPLLHWESLSSREQEAYLERRNLDAAKTFNCLIASDDTVSLQVQQVTRAYDRIQRILSGTGRFDYKKTYIFKNQDVFELSALLVQIQFIHQQYGFEEAQFFITYILQMNGEDAPGNFLLFAIFCDVLNKKGGTIDTRLISDAVTWSLFGDDITGANEDDPISRLFVLLTSIDEGGISWFGSDTNGRFNQWSQYLRKKTFKEHYDERHNDFIFYYGVVDHVENALTGVAGDAFQAVYSVARKFYRASLEALVDFSEDMKAFTHLEAYVQQTNMRMPTVNYEFESLEIDIDSAKSLLDRLIYYRKGDEAYEIKLLDADLHFTTPPVIEKEEAVDYLGWSQFVDYLFCGSQRTEHLHQDVIRKMLKENKFNIYHLLDTGKDIRNLCPES